MNTNTDMNKAVSLMKTEGFSAEQAISTTHPEWDDESVKEAAMIIRTMDKTAAVMQVGSLFSKVAADAKNKSKMTFSKAMDDSPALTGNQKNLPDLIQAKIIKSKMKKRVMKEGMPKEKMASNVSLIGLQYASNAMYANHIKKITGQEKTANAFLRMIGAPSTSRFTLGGTALGGLAGGASEAMRLFNMARSGKVSASGALSAAGKQADDAFLKQYQALGGKQGTQGVMDFIKSNPTEALKLVAPSMAKNIGLGAAAGGTAGFTAAKVGQGMAKRKALDTAKKVAVPAAVGLGGYAMLS